MAIQNQRVFGGIVVQAAYIRIDRIFGGKREGWNAVVGIYASASEAESGQPFETFNHHAAYQADEANPYALLYSSLKQREDMQTAIDV